MFHFVAAAVMAIGLQTPADQQNLWWGFLVRGPNRVKLADDVVNKMQTGHIDNFKRLHGLGKLLTAGPVNDPSAFRRGIVVLAIKDKGELAGSFAPDPYLSAGRMRLDAFPIQTEFGSIQTTGINPAGIEEHRLAYFVRGDGKVTAERITAHLDHLRASGKQAGLAFFARAKSKGPTAAVALFCGKDDAAIYKFLSQDPLVLDGCWTPVVIPQWISKGVLVPQDR